MHVLKNDWLEKIPDLLKCDANISVISGNKDSLYSNSFSILSIFLTSSALGCLQTSSRKASNFVKLDWKYLVQKMINISSICHNKSYLNWSRSSFVLLKLLLSTDSNIALQNISAIAFPKLSWFALL